jgi:hypothetical protein
MSHQEIRAEIWRLMYAPMLAEMERRAAKRWRREFRRKRGIRR